MSEFWELNPAQFSSYTKGYSERIEDQAKQIDYLNHMLGQYIAIGVNNGDKYPQTPFLTEQNTQKLTTEDLRAIFKKRYGKKNNGNRNNTR